jgi:hypothetical protein
MVTFKSDRKLIGEWEKARMKNAFSEEQKERMKDINNEFSLETIGENQWNLRQIQSFKFKHEDKVRQPGEPLFSTFKFETQEENSTLNFILTAVDATISELIIELDNNKEIELPVSLRAGETAKYNGGEWIEILDEFLKKTGEIKVNTDDFLLSKGNHSITFDCSFSNKGKEPTAKFEVRIPGKAEDVKG